MRAEREREAADEIARGNEAAQRVRASADRTVVETTSEAQKTADIILVRQMVNEMLSLLRRLVVIQSFCILRSLNAYVKSLRGDNSTMIISPDSEFFDYLKSDTIKMNEFLTALGLVAVIEGLVLVLAPIAF